MFWCICNYYEFTTPINSPQAYAFILFQTIVREIRDHDSCSALFNNACIKTGGHRVDLFGQYRAK